MANANYRNEWNNCESNFIIISALKIQYNLPIELTFRIGLSVWKKITESNQMLLNHSDDSTVINTCTFFGSKLIFQIVLTLSNHSIYSSKFYLFGVLNQNDDLRKI